MRSSSNTRRWPDREGLAARATLVAAAVAGGVAVAGLAGAAMSSRSADKASDAQVAAADRGIDEQRRQFDMIQGLLKPYVNAGTGALTAQQNLTGLNGNDAQAAAIAALQASPQFTSAQKLGETSILQNASATGGLRGGNTQAALGQFSPALLSATINDQYAKLGGLTSIGQNAAAGVGNAGMATGNNVTNLLQQQGAAVAGGALAQGRADAGYINAFGTGLGTYASLGGFKQGSSAGGASSSAQLDQYYGAPAGTF